MISKPETPDLMRTRFSLSMLGRHVIFLVVALALTVVVFEFWGQFGRAMGTVLGMNNDAQKNNGEVTVTVLPPKPCPKDQKCP